MIELTVFYYNDEQIAIMEDEDFEGHIPMSECASENRMFMSIDSFAPYVEGKKKYTSVYSGGVEWVCTLSYEELKHYLIYGVAKDLRKN